MDALLNLTKLQGHWILENPQWLVQWLDMLHDASRPEDLVGVRSNVEERKQGQCIKSLGEWAEQWKISKDAVRHFIDTLEKKNMIKVESLLYSTRLTINNFNTFITLTHDKRHKNTKNTNPLSLHTQIKKIFLVFYKETMDEEYYWTPIDGAKVRPLVEKILFKIKSRQEKNNIPIKDDYDSEIIEGFLFILNSITDEWMLKNLSMAIIDSKFNNIFSNLKANANKFTANKKPSKFDGYEDAYKLVMASRGLTPTSRNQSN